MYRVSNKIPGFQRTSGPARRAADLKNVATRDSITHCERAIDEVEDEPRRSRAALARDARGLIVIKPHALCKTVPRRYAE